MLRLITVSPSNEGAAAERLRGLILATWPDIAGHPEDVVQILVGLQTFRDIDLLVTMNLSTPRPVPPVRRRDGTLSAATIVQAACMVIEVKQLDPSRFEIAGNQIFPRYGGTREHRSVNQQSRDAAYGLRAYRDRYDSSPYYIHALGWLTAVPEDQLDDVEPTILGTEASWFAFLDAAAQQNASINRLYRTEERASIDALADRLTKVTRPTPLAKRRVDDLTTRVLVDQTVEDLAARVGTVQVRIVGRGGSGKTTTLALLAKRLATYVGARILILTFHRVLRSDIEHLMHGLLGADGMPPSAIEVETSTAFFASVLGSIGETIPLHPDGTTDYAKFYELIDEIGPLIGAHDVAVLKTRDAARFAWDYVFVDESQDWYDGERDFLRALYPSSSLVLADGLEQLVRRNAPCDWSAGIPIAERYVRPLNRSLRMMQNLALFARHFAIAAGLTDWKLDPHPELPGGQVIIALGDRRTDRALFARVEEAARGAGASPADCLICVPHTYVDVTPQGRQACIAPTLESWGLRVWDGLDESRRQGAPIIEPDQWRILQYQSCRGLEGWATIAFGLDVFYANRCKYPTERPEERVADAAAVARRWLMIPLTRAVHTLVINVEDTESPIVDLLRQASAEMPRGVVEWVT